MKAEDYIYALKAGADLEFDSQEIADNGKFNFRDSGIYLQSQADGKLTVSADGTGTDDITLSGHVTAGGMVLGHTAYTNSDSGSTASIDSFFINVDPTGGSTTIDLPTAGVTAGKVFVIQDSGGTANSNNITVATEGSENIDGSGTATIGSNYGALRVYSDGSNWFSF